MYKASHKLQLKYGILFIFLYLHLTGAQDCTFPEELWGTWTSTNLGTIIITGTSPSLTFSQLFTAQTVSENQMDCRFTSGSQYILESKVGIPTFVGAAPVFIWMCLDLRRASAYSYYYYLNSPTEAGFDNYRLIGLPDAATTASDVCTETLNVAEFNTMIKVGSETDAVDAVNCADPLLGSFNFTYTDSSGTYCEDADPATINACDDSNRTHIVVNNSDCSSVTPFYSTGGEVGCIANAYDSSTGIYYVSLYNLDTSPATQFVCVAVSKESNGTVYLSMKETDCASDQSPTVLPTGGATMILTPTYTCLLDTGTKKRNWTWLYIFLPCLVFLIGFIVVCLYLYFWLKKRERLIARRKTTLATGNHPLGEISLKLDAPESLGMQNGFIDRKRDLLNKPARRRKSDDEEDLLGEQSLDLNLEPKTWSKFEQKKHPSITEKPFSGAAVNGSNGSIPNRSVRKSKAPSSFGGRFKSRTKNFLTARMAANSLRGGTKSSQPKSYERSTRASSGRNSSLKFRSEIHPEPIKRRNSIAGSRPVSRSVSRAESRSVSRASSRRGSIDNLVVSRNKIMPRSKTMVLAKPKKEYQPEIYTMPEEYATEGGPNELMPSRPSPVTGNILRDAHQSINRRSNSHLPMKQPKPSSKPWH